MVIYKYDLPTPRSVVDMPKGARVLCAGIQFNGAMVIWAEVSPQNEREQRVFNALNTGDRLPPDRIAYIGTIQNKTNLGLGEIVWHIYEVGS